MVLDVRFSCFWPRGSTRDYGHKAERTRGKNRCISQGVSREERNTLHGNDTGIIFPCSLLTTNEEWKLSQLLCFLLWVACRGYLVYFLVQSFIASRAAIPKICLLVLNFIRSLGFRVEHCDKGPPPRSKVSCRSFGH